MDATALLLTVTFRHSINEPNIEAGYARFSTLVGQIVGYELFCDVVAECLRRDLIREPIRLPPGALQCHWHLELTPKGVATVKSEQDIAHNKQSVQNSRTLC
jgi:hypothetical protein